MATPDVYRQARTRLLWKMERFFTPEERAEWEQKMERDNIGPGFRQAEAVYHARMNAAKKGAE